MTNSILRGNPRVRFDVGEIASVKPRRESPHCKKMLMTVVVAFAAAAVWAKTTTWQGPSGGNWNAEDNWNGGLPATGDTVILNDSSVNDFEGLSLASITFAGSGAYMVSGNAVTVTDGLVIFMR